MDIKNSRFIKNGWYWVVILVVGVLGLLFAIFYNSNTTNQSSNSSSTKSSSSNNSSDSSSKSSNADSNTNSTTDKSLKEELEAKKSDFIKECKNINYKELARNPSKYVGEQLKFTGKVIQVNAGSSFGYRINVTKGKYDTWSDTVYVSYAVDFSSEPKILEDDIVTFYGAFSGEKTYKTVMDATVTIPEVIALYIDINN